MSVKFFFSKIDTFLDKIDSACCNEITSSADDFEIILKGNLNVTSNEKDVEEDSSLTNGIDYLFPKGDQYKY